MKNASKLRDLAGALISTANGGGGGVSFQDITHSSPGSILLDALSNETVFRVTATANIDGLTFANLVEGASHTIIIKAPTGNSGSITANLSAIKEDSLTNLPTALSIAPGGSAQAAVMQIGTSTFGNYVERDAGSVAQVAYRGAYVSGSSSANALPSVNSLSVTPNAGDRIVFISSGDSFSVNTSTLTFTAPTGATQVVDYPGNGTDQFNPQMRIWSKDYAGETDWGTWGAGAGVVQSHAIVVCSGASAVVASAVAFDQTAVPSAGTIAADSLLLSVNSLNYAGSAGTDEVASITGYTMPAAASSAGAGPRTQWIGHRSHAGGTTGGQAVNYSNTSNNITLGLVALSP